MGSWGAGGFENDAAADFVAGVASVDDLAALFDGLPDDVSKTIDADQAQRVVAAAECVAAMMGRPAADLPGDLALRLASFGDADAQLVGTAREGLSRILGWSDLTDLWAEDDPAAFNLAMTALIERLNPALPFDPPEPISGNDVGQTCGFCNGDIAPQDLVSVEIHQPIDAINVLDRGFWCHLACLNTRLHPGHIVQNWKTDPEDAQRAAERLVDC